MKEAEMRVGREPSKVPASILGDAAGLPMGRCSACERDVLAALHPERPGQHVCVHCDSPLARVGWVDERDLAELGYDAWDPLAGGCGGGCGGGGCGVRR